MTRLTHASLLAPLALVACTSDLDPTPYGFGGVGPTGVDGEDPLSLEERILLCEETRPTSCPGSDDGAMTRHGGLVDGAICQFQLVDRQTWAAEGAAIDALGERLPLVGVADVLADLDHAGLAVDGSDPELARLDPLDRAFTWDAVDRGDKTWMPQGVSGSFDAAADERIDGREVVAVSWYHNAKASGLADRSEVARISFADITDLDAGDVAYTHAVLADVYDNGGVPDIRPIHIHAGGIAWVGDHLYVADTTRGLRVFDTSRIIALNSDEDAFGRDPETGRYRAYGHRYAIPQIGAYDLADESCWHRFSFVALDKTTSPPSLVTGEFKDADIAGKLIRWNIDGDRLAATDPDTGSTHASEVYFAQESDMQGAVSVDGTWYLSSSGQDGAWGRLYATGRGRESTHAGWVIGPEDLAYSAARGALWSASEFAGRRYVFSVGVGR